jgi:transposase
MDLTDEQWAVLEPLFTPEREPGKAGRPHQEARPIVEAVLWVLRTGAPWKDLPSRYPPYSSCHRWFQRWCEDGTLKEVLCELARDLRERGGIEDIEAYIDGTYAPAKKGDPASGAAVPAMRRRSWRLQTALVFRSPLLSEMGLDTTSLWSTKPSTKRSSNTSRRS